MFLVKKVVLGAATVALVSTLCFGRDAISYLGASVGIAKNTLKDSVPLDFELRRARDMVKNLVPDIRDNMHLIAQEEVEVERLDKQVADLQTKVDRERGEVARLKDDLATHAVSFEYNGRKYDGAAVKTDLSRRFERFKTHEATLTSLTGIEHARKRSLEAARQKLEGMLAAKRQLEVEVENLEARSKMVEVAQTTSAYNFDDSRLGRVRELIGDLKARLAVSEKLVNADFAAHDEIALEPTSSDDIVEQVTRYFEQGHPADVAAESTDAELVAKKSSAATP